MEDVQIFSSQDTNEKNGSNPKIFIFSIALVILSITIAVASYILGTKFSNDSQSTSSSISPTQSRELGLSANTQAQTPTITKVPSITKKLTPTAKLSPSPTPTSQLLKSKILTSVLNLDGFMSSNGQGDENLEIRVGRNSSLVTRGFVTFEISEIPADADVQNATLRLYQTKVTGSPYVVGGKLKLDHLTYGDALDETDYAMPALTTSFETLSDNTKIGWKEVDVSSRLKDDIANARSVSQYRIHFETEVTGGDTEGDFVYFESQDNSEGSDNTPQLVVKYY